MHDHQPFMAGTGCAFACHEAGLLGDVFALHRLVDDSKLCGRHAGLELESGDLDHSGNGSAGGGRRCQARDDEQGAGHDAVLYAVEVLAVFKAEEVEADLRAEEVVFGVGEDERAVLKHAHRVHLGGTLGQGLEVVDMSGLRQRVPAQLLAQAERLNFLMLLLVHKGRGQHVVDFERIALQPGRVVLVRPGQVQQWHVQSAYEADILLIEPAIVQPADAVSPSPAAALSHLADWPSSFDLDAEELATCLQLITLLRRELDPAEITATSAALAQGLLLCLMLGLSRAVAKHAPDDLPSSALARRFLREFETLVTRRPSVEELACRLGVSTSTLTRNCRNTLGLPAKTLVDRRVALEAQRLLVHTEASSVVIGERLGFDEPTNFLKFFRRTIGTTPEAFRRAHRLP